MLIKNLKVYLMLACLVVFYSILYADNNGKSDKELSNKVNEYYNAEKKSDWKRTYSFRTPLYRKTIQLSLYINKMDIDNYGWKLVDFKITEQAIEGNFAAFKIIFIEEVPDGYFPNNLYKATRFADISTWEKIDGIWFCRDACSRGHLSLNGDMVIKNDQVQIHILKN